MAYKMTEAERQREISFIQDETQWVYPFCPVKKMNERDKTGFGS